MADTPLLYRLYVAASALMLPFAARSQIAKLRRAGFAAERAHEKLGHASLARRGSGPLIWFHAASVGESLSVLALITAMGKAQPKAQFLITSGTATSARLIAQRIPPNCQHQFAPLDAKGPVTRFLNHWRPSAAIFVESELWPQMLRRSFDRGLPMVLLNARLSARSLAGWARRPKTARFLLGVFRLIITQNAAMAQGVIGLGAAPERVVEGVNLKSLSGPLPVDQTALSAARQALKDRPVWVAASTHAGEEALLLQTHAQLVKHWPELCLILVPRHPERAADISALITRQGLSHSQRSAGAMPSAQVYLADTLGELGLWYALAPVVFLGGSLLPIGGHNPFEVAHGGAAILSGPYVTNFSETYDAMQACGAAQLIAPDDLFPVVKHLLTDATARATARDAASSFAQAQSAQLDKLADQLWQALHHG